MYSQLAYNKSTIRIIFYYVNLRSIISIIIFLFTKTPYTHCAIEINGAVYDGLNGKFQCNGRVCDLCRNIKIFDTNCFANNYTIDKLEFLKRETVGYNRSTITQYLLNKTDERKPYCTQAVALLLNTIGYNIDMEKRVGFNDILTKLNKNNRMQN